MYRPARVRAVFIILSIISILTACVKREHSNPLDPDYEIPGSGPSSPPLYVPANLSEIRTPRPFFDWADIERVDSYEIFVTDTTNLMIIQEKDVAVSYYSAATTLPDKKYYWKIRSRDGAGNWGGWSATWSFLVDTHGPIPPESLIPVSVSETADNTPRMDWEDIEDAVLYELNVMNCLDSIVVTDTSLVNSEYTIQTPVTDGAYFWKVRCRDRAGNWGNWSTVSSILILAGAPGVPDIQWVNVAGGNFQMGSTDTRDNASPVHSVTLSSFEMSKHEITNDQFVRFLNFYGSETVKSGTYAGKAMFNENNWGIQKLAGFWHVGSNYSYHPAVNITWHGANEFCKQYGFRLPTEAEWEYAARSGNNNASYNYSGSSNIDDVAWYHDNSQNRTHPVGSKYQNLLGIFDMSGNVEEWCSDWYGAYTSDALTNPAGPLTGAARVVRGGGFNSNAENCRNTRRTNQSPETYSGIGFRCVKGDNR
jgi:formylglycine-generating enzyme required for sulfatase activity